LRNWNVFDFINNFKTFRHVYQPRYTSTSFLGFAQSFPEFYPLSLATLVAAQIFRANTNSPLFWTFCAISKYCMYYSILLWNKNELYTVLFNCVRPYCNTQNSFSVEGNTNFIFEKLKALNIKDKFLSFFKLVGLIGFEIIWKQTD